MTDINLGHAACPVKCPSGRRLRHTVFWPQRPFIRLALITGPERGDFARLLEKPACRRHQLLKRRDFLISWNNSARSMMEPNRIVVEQIPTTIATSEHKVAMADEAAIPLVGQYGALSNWPRRYER